MVSLKAWKDALGSRPLWILSLMLLGLPTLGNAAPPPGSTPEAQGRHVMVTQDERDQGYQDAEATMTMILQNAAGQQSRRDMTMLFREMPGDGDKTLITFHFPRDIKGTGLLTFERLETADDQWLYLPAIKRVKRIASENKSGSFVGSEFSYEDIASNKPSKYTHKYLREDTHAGTPVWVIERDPKDPDSGYSKIITWVDQSNHQTVKQEFFDRKGALLKVQHIKGLTRYLGKFWRPTKIIMENVQTKKTTILQFEDWTFQQGLEDYLFTKRALERQR